MNAWTSFFIGLAVGLIPMIYGIIRAMMMTGGNIANFSWDATKKKKDESKKEINEVEINE